MRSGRFIKTPDERKQYTINYTNWLADSEQVTMVEFDIDPTTATPLVIDGSAIDGTGKFVTFYASGGEDDKQYTVTARITTDAAQIKEDNVFFSVNEI